MPPLATIVGGSLYAYVAGQADFTLETAEFAAQFSLGDAGSIALPLFVSNGSSFGCNATLSGGGTLRYGFVDFAGAGHQKLWFEGLLLFTTKSFIKVPSLPASGPIHLATTFTITGSLIAFPSDPWEVTPPKTFEYKLIGQGKVTARLTEASGGQRRVTSYFYQFT
jgi:hypothetical protein